MQRRDNGRRDLYDQPTNNRVRDRHFVNIAPLQFGEEASRVHSGIPASKRSTSFWKRGLSRNGSRRLSILMLPNKPCSKTSGSTKLGSGKRNASPLSRTARGKIAEVERPRGGCGARRAAHQERL